MCELFAVTAKRKITVNDTLKTFYSHSEEHKNGWGIYLKDEVLPLAAYGQFLSGEFKDVHIVTKGGSQGDETAIVRCLSFLKEMVTNEEKEGDL